MVYAQKFTEVIEVVATLMAKVIKKNHFSVQFDARPGVRNGPGLYLMWKVFEDSALMTASLAA